MKVSYFHLFTVFIAAVVGGIAGCTNESPPIPLTENRTLNTLLQSAEAVSVVNLDDTSLDTIVLQPEQTLGQKSADSIPPPERPSRINGLVKYGNYLYAGDNLSSCIWMLDLERDTWVRKVGRRGRGPGEFMELAGILGNTRNIFAVDMASRRIHTYDQELNLKDTHLEVIGFYDKLAATDALFYGPPQTLVGEKNVIQPYTIDDGFSQEELFWPRLIPQNMSPQSYNDYHIDGNSHLIAIVQHGLPYIFLVDAHRDVKHAIYVGSTTYEEMELSSAQPVPNQGRSGLAMANSHYIRTPVLEENGVITFSVGRRLYRLVPDGDHYRVDWGGFLSFEKLDSRKRYVRIKKIHYLIAEKSTLYMVFAASTHIFWIKI